MNLRPEEISSVIKEQIKQYSTKLETSDVGTVIQVADGIARIHGLEKAMQGELLEFPGDVFGMVLNLEEDNVGAVLLGPQKYQRRRPGKDDRPCSGSSGRRCYDRPGGQCAGSAN